MIFEKFYFRSAFIRSLEIKPAFEESFNKQTFLLTEFKLWGNDVKKFGL